jgi:hypothetical protein
LLNVVGLKWYMMRYITLHRFMFNRVFYLSGFVESAESYPSGTVLYELELLFVAIGIS